MSKKNQEVQDENLENVQEALNTSSQWIEEHKNVIMGVVAAVIVVVCGILAINNFVIKPKALAAQNESAKAVVYFHAGDFQTALNGDSLECMGFAAIADEYSSYQAGELAALYAGICQYKLGNYEEAASYLKKFSADDVNIDPAAKMLLGDAYVQLDNLSAAIKQFKAVADTKNEMLAPMALKKLAVVYLEQNDNKAAQKAFEQIKDLYPMSAEAAEVDKFIAE